MKGLFLILLGISLTIGIIAQEDDTRGYIVQVGDACPDFTLKFPDGSGTRLAELKGKVFMLQFTASWCGVCRKEMPHIEKDIWQAYRDQGLVVIGVDRGEDPETVRDFEKKMKITYPLALDQDESVFRKFAHPKAGVTRNVLVDRNGKIIFLTRLFNEQEFEALKDRIASEFEN